jgi:hypothetical protein
MGRRQDAQEVVNDLLEHSERTYVPPVFPANVYLALKDISEGFNWLNKAFDVRDGELTWLKTYPIYDHIRSDPRYSALLKKMNLED